MNCQSPFCHNSLTGSQRRFCSDKCRAREYYLSKRRGDKPPVEVIRECRYCGKTFETDKANRRICSDRCRVTAARIGRESFQKRMRELNRYKIEQAA